MKRKLFLVLSILWGFYLVFAIITYLSNIRTYMGADFVISSIFLLVFVLIEFLFISKYKKLNNPELLKKQEEELKVEAEKKFDKEKNIPGSHARIKFLNSDLCIQANHMAGLPINEGAETFLYRCEDKVIFERNDMTFELPLDKIRDITIKTDVEIQKSYVSSVGGAVGGYVLFGPLGAMVGGRAKEKKSKTVEEYLIFAYEKGDETVYISFEVTTQKYAKLFINLLDNKSQERKTVQL